MNQHAIEQLFLVDLDIAALPGQSTKEACKELVTGLLVRHEKLIPAIGSDWPVIRFTGPRNQLQELINRYAGIDGTFAPAPCHPDSAVHNPLHTFSTELDA